MKDVVLNRYSAFKVNSEGGKNHLYVDTTGNITVGIGCAIFNKAQLRKEFKLTKVHWSVADAPHKTVTEEMIEADWDACYAVTAKMGSNNVKTRQFKAATKLRLSKAGIEAYTQFKMKAFEATMFEHLSREQWEAFPADAQFACIAMQWGGGIWPNFTRRNPKLAAAIKAEDFLEAVKHIDFDSNGNAKVRAFLNKTYKFCLANAAASMPKGCRNAQDNKPAYFLNPNLLYWPAKWEYDAESEIAFESDWMPEKV